MSGDENAIIALLPYVRRYARALTGSQSRGDTYVRLCLETIMAEPARLRSNNLKVQLFRAFNEALAAVDGNVPPPAFGEQRSTPLDRRERGLAALPSMERQILLLTHLEEFTLAESAVVLGISELEASSLLASAKREVQIVSSVPILIIEDEPMIALELASIVRDMGHRVCGMASRQSEAIDLAVSSRPDLILADIQLKGEDSGIVAVQEILKQSSVPIIFVTGYPERLLTGERLEPAFVIPKPFSSDMLKIAIGQALSVVARESTNSSAA